MKTWTKKFQKMLTLILAICLVTGCMGFSNVQAATGKSGTTYYDTCINGKKGGTITTNGTKYYMSGTRKAICKVVLCQEKVQIKYNQFSLFM